MSSAFKILHLSDLHIASDADRLPSPLQTLRIRAVLDAIGDQSVTNWVKPASHSTRAARAISRFVISDVLRDHEVDLVVVSGDLAATGIAEDLSSAKAYLGPHSGEDWVDSRNNPIFVVNGKPICAVPGNHDRYRNNLLLPGAVEFDAILNEFWKPESACGRVGAPITFQRAGDAVAVVFADFSFRRVSEATSSTLGYIGRGHIHADVLANLEAATVDILSRSPLTVVVWVVHFPPGFPNGSSSLALEGEEHLLAAAGRHGVRLLLAGHTHTANVYQVGDLTVACAGTAMQADSDEKWQFALYTLNVDAGALLSVDVVSYSYVSTGRNNFVPGAVDRISIVQ